RILCDLRRDADNIVGTSPICLIAMAFPFDSARRMPTTHAAPCWIDPRLRPHALTDKYCSSQRRETSPTVCLSLVHRKCAAQGKTHGRHVNEMNFSNGSHPDQLTASAPMLDGYCFTLNFGHATGASLHSHNVPLADGCSAANAVEQDYNHKPPTLFRVSAGYNGETVPGRLRANF